MDTPKRRPLKVLEVLLVLGVLVALTAVLLPTLSKSREAAQMASLRRVGEYFDAERPASPQATLHAGETRSGTRFALAHVKSFVADIELTPKLSVGTAEAESIYEARFNADIVASPPETTSETTADCEIQLPLPPQIISLADLDVASEGKPIGKTFIGQDTLIWRGKLPVAKETPITVVYSAVGKGIYTLETPPGRIIETYRTTLTANDSDIRMMQLSLQPVEHSRTGAKTIYKWDYKKLMFGRPIALDVLGIAPIDKLGELGWLAPVSVLLFGVLVALIAMAFEPDKLNKWMLLLIVGTFCGSYPLMYFAQEFAFLKLTGAIVLSVAVVVVVIAVRAFTLLRFRVALSTVAMALVIQAVVLAAAIHNDRATQGVLLTVLTIAALIAAMTILPKAHKSLAAASPPEPSPREDERGLE